MALIHYYKFNGNLFDSVGGFDLVNYQYGTGFSTGILNNCLLANSFETRVSGQGNAPSAWLSSNTSEASAGVSEWTITGWVYIDSVAAMSQLIFETITPNGNTPQISFAHDIKNGKFSLNGNLYTSISALNTWHLVAIRKSGGNIYWSINSGTESSFSYVPTTSGNLTQFNGFRIGGTGTGYGFYYGKVDDFRLYNNNIGSSGVASIYNGGSPSEASSSALKWETPIHHYKFTNNLNDSIGSDNATTFSSVTYPSGLFVNSPKCIELDDFEYIEATGASNWSTDSWSVAFWQAYTGTSYTVSEVFKIQGSGSGTNITWDYNPKTNFSWNLNGTFMFLDQWSSLDNRLLSYNHIAQRYSLFVKDFAYAVGEYSASGFPINYFSAGLFYDPGPTTVFQLDDLRIYNQALSGLDALQIYNSGNGTEYSTTASSGNASGSFATVIISGLSGSAIGTSSGGSASGNLSTILISSLAGIAIGTNGTNAIGIGGLGTIVMSGPSGYASFGSSGWIPVSLTQSPFGSASASAAISKSMSSAVGIITLTGSAIGGATGTGSSKTITVSGLTGSATAGTGAFAILPVVSLAEQSGSATGSAIKSTTFATIAITSTTGLATGSAIPSSGLGVVTLSGPAGSALGSAPVTGTLSTVSISAAAVSAFGSAVKSGILGAITITAPAGLATGMAPANGAFSPVVITAPAGSVIGMANVSSNLATISLTPPGVVARGSTTAAGSLASITLSAITSASAIGSGIARASGVSVAISQLNGSASVSVSAIGSLTSITVLGSLTNTSIGSAIAAGSSGFISIVAPNGRAFAGSTGTPASVHIIDLPKLEGTS